MKGLEQIIDGKKLVAIVFRKNIKVSGIKFFTDENNPLQIGIHNRKKGIVLSPHIHKIKKPIQVSSVQEVLLVQKGKIRLTLYSKDRTIISKKILSDGDSVLLVSGGHGVDFLHDSRIFEVKQGPYPGLNFAKIYYHK